MIKGPVPEARLQLHPESLGKVSIELKIEDGQVHAKVWVQEPAAMQALQEGRASLEQALKQSGLQLGSFDLQQGGDASRQAPEPNSHQGPAIKEDPALRAARQEAPALGGPPPANSRRIELYA
jgi:flagellar hook-length control protein FliK